MTFEQWWNEHNFNPDDRLKMEAAWQAAKADGGEAVYLFSADGEKWIDVVKSDYDKILAVDTTNLLNLRILYTSPIAAQQAAEEMKKKCVEVCDKEGNEWDSDNVVTEKNYAHACRDAIKAIPTE